MSAKGSKQFLEAVVENPQVIQYVKLFRMPLFMTVLEDELKKADDSVWETETAAREAARQIMPITLQQFGIPRDETDQVIEQCVAAFLKK